MTVAQLIDIDAKERKRITKYIKHLQCLRY